MTQQVRQTVTSLDQLDATFDFDVVNRRLLVELGDEAEYRDLDVLDDEFSVEEIDTDAKRVIYSWR